MRHTILTLCLIMVCPSAVLSQSPAQTSYRHAQTGITWPQALGSLKYMDVVDYAQMGRPDLGVSVRYALPNSPARADIYLFDLKRKNLGTGIGSPEVRTVFEMARQDIYTLEKRGSYKGVRKIEEGKMTLSTASGELPVFWARFTYDRLPGPGVTYAGPVVSYLYVTAYKNVFMKIRFTFPQNVPHQKALQQFLADLGKILT